MKISMSLRKAALLTLSLASSAGVFPNQALAANWLYSGGIDPMSDRTDSQATTKLGEFFDEAVLGVKCEGTKLFVFARKGNVFHIDETIEVQFRIDSEVAKTNDWYWLAKLNMAVTSGAEAQQVASQFLTAAERIVFKVGDESATVFGVESLGETVTQVLRDCGLD